MNKKELEKILEDEWLKVDTWHTSHPLDEKRFHKALERVFKEIQLMISCEQFENAISNVVQQPLRKEEINRFASKAEYISSYISDIQEI